MSKMQALPSRTGDDPVFERILCATELTDAGAEAVRQAAVLAGAGGSLEIVSVAPRRPPGAPRPQARQIEALVNASALAEAAGVRATTHIVDAAGETAGLLTRCAGHDLLVAAASEPSLAALPEAPVPVLIARPAPAGSSFPDSIIVAVDGTPAAHEAACVAGRLAARHGALVALVAAPEHDAPHQQALEADVEALRELTGTRPLVLDEQRLPVTAILGAATSAGASLIVLGSRPGSPAGSISAQIARRARTSVLVMRPHRPPHRRAARHARARAGAEERAAAARAGEPRR